MIKIKNIKKTFNPLSKNKNEVLKGVSIDFPDTGLVAIFGKSGSGKTTLLNIIGGLEKADSGEILFNDEKLNNNEDKLRNKLIGYIFQNYYLEKNSTIVDIMHNQMIIAGYNDEKLIEERTKEVLELVDMYRFKNKRSDALSGGQKQRVAIARALIKGSDVILADEPTGNLDNENTIHVMEILKKISKTKLVVLVTHEQNLIRDYADTYIPLVDGLIDYNLKVDTDINYEINKNNIYLNKDNYNEYKNQNINLKIYGNNNIDANIEIINDKNKVFIIPNKNVEILNEFSEKKIIYEEEKEKSDIKLIDFKNTSTNKRGKLFKLKNIFKVNKESEEEKILSLSSIIKLIFILGFAVIVAFLAMNIFDISNKTIIKKKLDDNTIYTNLSNYTEIRKIKEEKYDYIDFFETEYRNENFSFDGSLGLSSINVDCEIRALEDNEINLNFGNEIKESEIYITTKLANNIINEFRIDTLKNKNTLLMMNFKSSYHIAGIVDGDNPIVYMKKNEYVNYLGVYKKLQFNDYNNYLISNDYSNQSFESKIKINDDYELKNDECSVIINRNSLYKMMKNTGEADYLVDYTNNKIKIENKAIQLKNSKLFVKSFEISRNISDSDIVILVNSNVMKNIFVNISPSIDNLNNDLSSNGLKSNYYFKIKYGDSNYELLNEEFINRSIQIIDINQIYENNINNLKKDLYTNLYIFLLIVLLMYCVFYLIEKSGSLKNSKEYGIYRAIGVNKTNLLFKEFILSIYKNLIPFTLFYILVLVLIGIRYYILNINLLNFILISFASYGIISILLMFISLIPYLFVLFNTPARILARYDI